MQEVEKDIPEVVYQHLFGGDVVVLGHDGAWA